MKGRSEIADAAAVALVQLYKRYELHLSAQSEERTRHTDGWNHLRHTWHALTEELNTEFGLEITTEQWKKKISNIKTNVKSKRALANSEAKVNWSAAELEYDRLFARECSVSTNAGSSDCNDSKCQSVSNGGEACNEMFNMMDELLEKSKFIVPKMEADLPVTNTTPAGDTKKKTPRGTKRGNSSSSYGAVPAKTPSPHPQGNLPLPDLQQLIFGGMPFNQVANANNRGNSGNCVSPQIQAALDNFLVNSMGPYAGLLGSFFSGGNTFNAAAGLPNTSQMQSNQCVQAQLDAANAQKSAADKLGAVAERLGTVLSRFEAIVTKLESSSVVQSQSRHNVAGDAKPTSTLMNGRPSEISQLVDG